MLCHWLLDLCYGLIRMKSTVEKATGGGAYKYADLFRERLGINVDKKDEMDCLVAGANFLLKVGLLYHILIVPYRCYCAIILLYLITYLKLSMNPIHFSLIQSRNGLYCFRRLMSGGMQI